MVRSILKERPTAPKLRRVSSDVPEALAETMEQLKGRADARGFDLSIGEPRVDAYARLAKRIARELDGDALDDTAVGALKRDGALPRHGARSCVTHLDRSRDRLGGWLDGLQSRMRVNKVTVALAAKIARTAWAIMTRPGALYKRRDPAVA